jgi:Mg-chelatase subunit ChlD
MSSAFTQAMDSQSTRIAGENGAAELSTTTDPRLDLFFALVRNLGDDRLNELVKSCFAHSTVSADTMAVDMFLLAFQTRDCRGGKGERSLFHKLFLELASRFPQTAIDVLPLIPKYGYYKDLFLLAGSIEKDKKEKFYPLRDAVVDLAVQQLFKDLKLVADAKAAGEKPKGLSLLAKWAPRESGSQKEVAKLLARKMFPDSSSARAQYRKALAELNVYLGTVEVKMCGNEWAEIEPTAVPSLALMRNRKAFLNEKVKGVPTAQEIETGNRFPEDENRVACRKRVREALVSKGLKKLKGKQLFPHEICKELMGRGSTAKSTVELEIFNAQWTAIRTATQEALAAKRAETESNPTPGGKAVDLGKLVSIVDVSGSMSGTPMEVAIALGILVSELSDPAFANRVITFDDNPTWCKFEEGSSISEKVKTAQKAPWGGSTDFAKSYELILNVAVAAKLNPEDIPNLIVFSDMQFNQADHRSTGEWETHYERFKRRFEEAGMRVCGKPWPAPEITFWNLRGDTVGFPVDANAPSVRLLSGFSPSLLKLLMSGEPLEVEVEEEVEVNDAAGGGVVIVKTTKKVVDPLSTLRKALDDATYDDVRVVLSNSKEGSLASYTFTPPVVAVEVTESSKAAEMSDDWEEVEK